MPQTRLILIQIHRHLSHLARKATPPIQRIPKRARIHIAPLPISIRPAKRPLDEQASCAATLMLGVGAEQCKHCIRALARKCQYDMTDMVFV